MSVVVSSWISAYCNGGDQNDAELDPWDFFSGTLACSSACLWAFLAWVPCILPPPLCSCLPGEFGTRICGSVITLAGIEMSHSKICLWLCSVWEQGAYLAAGRFQLLLLRGFPAGSGRIWKWRLWVFDLLATKPMEMFLSPLFCT